MRKYLSILLSTMLVLLTLLSSCGKASETKNSNINNDTNSTISSEQASDTALTSSALGSETASIIGNESTPQQESNAVQAAGNTQEAAAGNSKSTGSTAASIEVKSASSAASSASSSTSGKGNTSSATITNPSSSTTSSSKPAGSSSSYDKSSSAGDMGTFTMTDLNGNAVNQSIFNNYTLTMVNVWATYCNPCIKEMPGIKDVYNQVKGKGVNIIGVVSDGTGKLDTVKEIVNKTGASYKMYIPSSSMLQNSFMSNISFVPTTFFVDRNGNRVGSPISGSKTADQWLKTVNDMLARVS
ncbi:TlpA family protein disulfide reductase [Acetanaerobacterium elongatum]|uniref:Thiol-disulfide isomerase or thioredoxin n=1 Tax=Acetanaerobacterium elongatum TaxID=258515 RepID=A0A1H0FYR7_9FIRM|nr:TlpA disulfide reductase family protein [Acetanaerobacterium elongatum]SDN99649.1 Thiol-disulfide isomerase or thioredoxin [Acetanaerobacterium elongatum]